MHRARLDNLSDGIFAIVMTLLVLDFQVPAVFDLTNESLFAALKLLSPVFLSYLLSFLVLATYWIGHHYMLSLIAQNLNRRLTYLNIPFLLFVALIPFSAKLLSTYYFLPIAVMVYGLNVIIIGLALLLITNYIIRSPEIKTDPQFTSRDFHNAYLRILIPPVASFVAILVSFWNPKISLAIFILSILVNLIPGSLHLALRIFGFEKSLDFKKD